ncbi:MAG: histidinol-phosphate transaminase [Candidatus Sumerlaeota bacterium]
MIETPKGRDLLQRLEPYTPGEQPSGTGILKLNTNENPYPPPSAVVEEVRAATGERLRLYPNPSSESLRRALAAYHAVDPDQVLLGNGSDEILRLLVHAFIDPGMSIAVVDPTYSLYPVLSETYDGNTMVYPLVERENLPEPLFTAPEPLLFLPNPNPPIGTFYDRSLVARLCREREDRLVLIDEAYVDFAPRDMVPLLSEYPNLAISRTFSKSYSLAGMRIGYLLGHADLIHNISKIKDSYNLNALSQIAGAAAISAFPEMQENARKIMETRRWTTEKLQGLGYTVPESHGNFVFAIHPDARDIFLALKARKILVRYFDTPTLCDGMRITIGTARDMERLIAALEDIHVNHSAVKS